MTEGRVSYVPLYKPGELKKPHSRLVPANFTPPTHNPDDCECGGGKPGAKGRLLMPNCPCCDGIQTLKWEECNCDGELHLMKVILPPEGTTRIRYIDNVKPIE